MHFSIVLALAATRVLAESSNFILDPPTVTAGELTQIKVTLVKQQTCPQTANAIQLQVTGVSNRSFIVNHEPAYFNTPTEELLSFPDYFFLTFRQNVNFNFPPSITSGASLISHLSLDPVGPAMKKPYKLTLFCGSLKEEVFTPEAESLLTEELNITVIAAPALPEVVKLTPSKANSTLVSTIAMEVPWPKECRTTKKPLVKLSLDPETIRDGGALSSDPQPGYFVYGLEGNTRQLISDTKSNETIKKDNFTTIMFQRYSYALHNQVNLTFKFLGQQVPEGTVKDTHLKVEFVCENLGVKLYAIETDNSPIIKVSHAISVSVAISTVLLSFLAFLV